MTSPCYDECLCVCVYVVIQKQWGDSVADSNSENTGNSPDYFVSQDFLMLKKHLSSLMMSV